MRATEIQLLQSPEEESWASVRKVLDFRDELDEVAEAMAMGSKLEITSLEVLSTHWVRYNQKTRFMGLITKSFGCSGWSGVKYIYLLGNKTIMSISLFDNPCQVAQSSRKSHSDDGTCTNRSPLVQKDLDMPAFLNSQMEAPASSSFRLDTQRLLQDRINEVGFTKTHSYLKV